MDNILTITNTKEMEFEFGLEIGGLAEQPEHVRFVMETNIVNLSFNCVKQEDKWVVKIPPMPQIERTSYPFTIEVVIDGYFFEPMKGFVNVVASSDLYVKVDMPKITSPEKTESSNSNISVPNSVQHKEEEEEEEEEKEEVAESVNTDTIAAKIITESKSEPLIQNNIKVSTGNIINTKVKDMLEKNKKKTRTASKVAFKKGTVIEK